MLDQELGLVHFDSDSFGPKICPTPSIQNHSTLNICNENINVFILLDTTRLTFAHVTEEEVGTLISNWLRHAKQRRERAEGYDKFK